MHAAISGALLRQARLQRDWSQEGLCRGDLAREMCALVRLRLEDEDYLRNGDYGRRLLSLFDRCRRELPIGYAVFHLPWVAEWYTAARQYRAAYELLRDFPVKVPLPR